MKDLSNFVAVTFHKQYSMSYRKCPKCDSLNPETANFCNHCGIPLGENEATPITTISFVDEDEELEMESAPCEPSHEKEQDLWDDDDNESGSSHSVRNWLFCILIVLVALGIGCFYLSKI